MKKVFCLCLCVLGFSFSAGLVSAQTEIRIDGSTTVGPVVDAFVGAFRERRPDLRFSVQENWDTFQSDHLKHGKKPRNSLFLAFFTHFPKNLSLTIANFG